MLLMPRRGARRRRAWAAAATRRTAAEPIDALWQRRARITHAATATDAAAATAMVARRRGSCCTLRRCHEQPKHTQVGCSAEAEREGPRDRCALGQAHVVGKASGAPSLEANSDGWHVHRRLSTALVLRSASGRRDGHNRRRDAARRGHRRRRAQPRLLAGGRRPQPPEAAPAARKDHLPKSLLRSRELLPRGWG
jgi:hypothetical protein